MSDARALIESSAEARRRGDRAAARKLANEAAEMSKASRDRKGLGAALAALGRLHRDDHDYDAALASYEEAAELARESGDELALAHRLRHIGDILTEQGQLSPAEQRYDEAGPIFERLGIGQLAQANFLRSTALLKEKQGERGAAADLWTMARTLYAATGTEAGVQESDRRLANLKTA
ncbi:MAG TPA: tetratricopeptide repeat protein [Sphingomicrobium sp.]|jgi:tetratricopeptide (TPR) repeat protein|nr:tetratricopeptide repeat protein [Sphingomicrobium sp.]